MLMMIVVGWTQNAAFGQEQNQNQKNTVEKLQRKAVHLYFSDRKMRFLSAEKRELVCAADDVSQGQCIVSAMIQGPQSGLMETLPQGTELKSFYVTGDGTAYVDFNDALGRNLPGGIRSELLAVFAIVNSLTLNLSNVNRVQFLIDGRQRETLAGHVDISDPFKANILLIR